MRFIKEFNWKRSLITVTIVLITAVVVGGSVWYVMDRNARSEKEKNDQQIAYLQEQIEKANVSENLKVEKTDCDKTYRSKIYPFSIDCPTGWKVSEEGANGLPGVLSLIDNNNQRFTITINDPGSDIGMASYMINYTATILDNKVLLSNRQESTTDELAEESFTLNTSSIEQGNLTLHANSYRETKEQLLDFEEKFKTISQSIKFE